MLWGGQSWPQPPFRRLVAQFFCDTVGQPLFVSFRLHASLPAHRVFPPNSLARSGRAFVVMPNHVHVLVIPKGHGEPVVSAIERTYGWSQRPGLSVVECDKPPKRRLRPGVAAPHFVTQ